MRSPLFGKLKLSLRSSALVFLALFLSFSALVNLALIRTPNVYAATIGDCSSGDDCYYVSVTGGDGKEIARYGIKAKTGDTIRAQADLQFKNYNELRNPTWSSAEYYSSSQVFNEKNANGGDKKNYKIIFRVQGKDAGEYILTQAQAKGLSLRILNPKGKTINVKQNGSATSVTGSSEWSTGALMISSKITDSGAENSGASGTDLDTGTTVTNDEIESGQVEENAGVETLSEEEIAESTPTEDNDTVSDVTCSKATAGLGWILCSLGELASTILKTLYEKFIMPALQIRPVLLDRDNGTYAVWATFRDIANILFVIYLLVVIMSQLTGIGIDNYGIKKSLPRLIVAAILVNVSYLICQLAVDVSNVIGASLYNFLANIEISGYQDFVDMLQEGNPLTGTGHDAMSNWATYLIAGGFLTGTIWMQGSFAAAATSAVVPVLGALFGAAVSVIFMFAMLSFRNAVVVIGVALSPLAFVCYILPSTKKIYDRWLAIMKGMIFLYPICSIVIGGGYLASRIILGSGGADSDVFLIISAIVAEVAPFFAVPSLVRAAYKATGELGARLNGMSLMASRRAQFSFRRSQFAQDLQENSRIRAARGITRRRFTRPITTRRTLAEANKTLLAAEKRQREIDAMNDAENIQALSTQSQIADETQLAKNREYARQLGLSGNAPAGAQVQVNGANITAQTLQDATIQQAVIGQENQLRELPLNQRMTEARAGLLRNNDYIDMRKAQQDASISNETTKMYEEMYGKMTSVDDLKAALGAALTDGNINKSERLSAVIKAMNSKGMKEDMLQHMFNATNSNSFSATINAGRATGATAEQKRLSGTLVDALASSGIYTLQEYAKYIGKQPGTSGVVDLRSFASSNSTTSGASLASAFNDAKGDALAKMDRDEIKAINGLTSTLGAGNLGAWAGVSPEAWAKHAAGLTNGKDINAFRDAMSQCTNDQREQIAHSFTPESFTQANHDTRRAIFNPTYDERTHTYTDPTRNAGGAANIATLYRPLVDQINNDDQLRSRFSANANIRTELGVNP